MLEGTGNHFLEILYLKGTLENIFPAVIQ